MLKSLDTSIDLNGYSIDLYFFFKNSAARQIEYSQSEEITKTTTQYMLRHVETRWHSIAKVLIHKG